MKVLWFTNTSCNAAEYLGEGPIGGGWLKSLDKALQGVVELHVAFYYPKMDVSFKYKSTTYHPLSKGNWKLKAILGLFWGKTIDNEDLGKYLKIIGDVKPDIIHIHGTENPFGCLVPNIKIPVVVSIQGCITVYHHKFTAGFSRNALRVHSFLYINNIRNMIREKSFYRLYKEFAKGTPREQKNLRHTKYIIGRTSWDRRITSIFAPQSTYYHGEELLRGSFYEKTWVFQNNERLIIHTTTSNSAYKGFETLCEALFEIQSRTSLNISWQIAGINPNDSIVKLTKAKLSRKFPKHGLVYLGSLNEYKLVESLCEANMYVLPSHIENSPNSLCEAMILGLPCIATFAGGTGSLLENGKEGILIQDGDPWVLAGAILELYNNPELARLYSRNARTKALNRHDPAKIVESYLNIYLDIIGVKDGITL